MSDLHLSPEPPPAWAGAPDWYAAQAGYLKQINDLAGTHRCPVVCAGDVFHHWRVPPECINFALAHLPPLCAVPGQHDLPYHDYAQVRRSAYWTLVEAGRVRDLKLGEPLALPGLVLHGFPWGFPITPLTGVVDRTFGVHAAIVHAYAWVDGHRHPGAPEGGHAVRGYGRKLKGYDLAVFGDNHSGFECEAGGAVVFNCGGMMRRNGDEGERRPHAGLITASGRVVPHYFDTAADHFRPAAKEGVVADPDAGGFLHSLRGLGHSGLDYREAVRRHLSDNKVGPGVRRAVLWALEGGE